MKIKPVAALLWFAVSGTAQAALHDRGGSLIYDDVLNVTWLQDANYGAGSIYDDGLDTTDGRMTWDNAKAWVERLSYGGFDDWRLPTVVDMGPPGCDWSSGGTDCGQNPVPESGEMAYMYYVNLGNIEGAALANVGPFINLQNYSYWYSTASAAPAYPGEVWAFTNYGGIQYEDPPDLDFHAWAVRDGDVAAVPEPETYAMMLVGLGLVGAAARRRCS